MRYSYEKKALQKSVIRFVSTCREICSEISEKKRKKNMRHGFSMRIFMYFCIVKNKIN